MNSIYHVRLINGQELIGEWLGDTEETKERIIKSPMAMTNSPHADTPGIVLSRYTTFDDIEVLSFKPEHIITFSPVIPEMAEYYKLSVEYTERVAKPGMLAELSEVNTTLKTLLTAINLNITDQLQSIDEVLIDKEYFAVSSSNTLH